MLTSLVRVSLFSHCFSVRSYLPFGDGIVDSPKLGFLKIRALI
jgi:hypothetical protein